MNKTQIELDRLLTHYGKRFAEAQKMLNGQCNDVARAYYKARAEQSEETMNDLRRLQRLALQTT